MTRSDTARGPWPWAMWGIALGAYTVAVFQRGSLAVSGLAFEHRFQVGPAELSIMAVLQLGVYAAMQIPVGLILDRVGPRVLMGGGAVLMGGGQALMAFSHRIPEAILARILVGAGDATTFISALRVVGAWFPSHRVPLLTQITGIIGQLGQVVAAYPLVTILHAAGWTPSFAGAATASGLVVAIVLIGLRETPTGRVVRPAVAAGSMRRGLQESWAEPGTRMGLWTHFVNQFSGNVFALLWGFPFLVAGEGLSSSVAGGLISIMVLVGMGVGPALGGLSGQWPLRRSVLTMVVVGSTAAMWTVVLAWPGRAPVAVLTLLVLVLSANGPGSLIAFDYVRTFNPPERMGSASGIVNVGGFIASLVMIGVVGGVLGGLGSGTLDHFRLAFLVQYALWAFGLAQVVRMRRVLRARRRAEGVIVDPFHRAVRRQVSRYGRSRTPGSGDPSGR